MKSTTEGVLQEKQRYSHLLNDCMTLSISVSSAELAQDRVNNRLKKEEQLTNENRCMLEKQIYILLDKMRYSVMIQSLSSVKAVSLT